MVPPAPRCHNQQELTTQVVGGLLHERHPCCWNIVVPPGFGEVPLGEALQTALRGHPSRPLVAVVSPDEVDGLEALLKKLRRQWLGDNAASTPPANEQGDVAFDRLMEVVYQTAERDAEQRDRRPVILVLKRFHKVLDHLESWLLAKLYTEEQAKRLQTVTLTPLPYKELKRRWEARGHIFSSSEYGNTHTAVLSEPLTLEAARVVADNEGISGRIADFLWQQTGGYPEVFHDVVGTWIRERFKNLDEAVRERVLRLTSERLDRFVKWLDPLEDRRYRQHLLKFYWDAEDLEAYEVLCVHPWKNVLFRESALRAEALGAAALRAAERDVRERRTVPTEWVDALHAARDLYEHRKYQAALSMLDSVEVHSERSLIHLQREHARIMKALYGAGNKAAQEDTHWRALRDSVREAQRFLERHGGALEARQRTRLQDRYDELGRLADRLAAAANVRGPYQGRLVDILAGLAGPATGSPRDAALLLWAKYETTRAIEGPSEACLEALYLPEQILRVWAFWRVGLNYYEAPQGVADVWDDVERSWRREVEGETGSFRRGEPGKNFPSFQSFACFALAYQRLRQHQDADFTDLESDLSFYEQVRNPKAHAWAATPEKHRPKYFDLIRRWLDRMLAACPEAVREESLRMILDPLPPVA